MISVYEPTIKAKYGKIETPDCFLYLEEIINRNATGKPAIEAGKQKETTELLKWPVYTVIVI